MPAVSDVNTGNIFIPRIAANSEWWTGISILNTTSSSKELLIEFDNGMTATKSIAAKEHQAFNINRLYGGTIQPDIKSAVIKNGSGIIGLELFGGMDGNGANYLSGILLKDDFRTNIYYPHIASDSKWWTGTSAYNPSGTSCSITITPFREDGIPLRSQMLNLDPQEKYIGTVKGLNFPAETAWFKISSTRPITGFELFGTRDGRQLAGYTGVGISNKNGVFAKIEPDGWTGIAFVNIESCSTKIIMSAFDDSGRLISLENLDLNAYEKVVAMPYDLFSQNITEATYIAYSSSGNVVGFQLNGSSDDMMLDALPGMYGSITQEPEIEKIIGSAGGVVEVTDPESPLYGVKLEIPSGALDFDQNISIRTSNSRPSLPSTILEPMGEPISFSPSGTQFKSLVEVTLPYDDNIDETKDVVFVAIHDKSSGEWQIPTLLAVDEINNRITVGIRHFSDEIGVIIPANDLVNFAAQNPGTIPEFKNYTDGFPIQNHAVFLPEECKPGACWGMCTFTQWYFKNKRTEDCPLFDAYRPKDITEDYWPIYGQIACDAQNLQHNSLSYANIDYFIELSEFSGLHRWTHAYLLQAFILHPETPKCLSVYSEGFKDGHAILVHGWDNDNNHYEVYDPSYSKLKYLKFDGETFEEYQSKINSDGPDIIFKHFIFMPSEENFDISLMKTVADKYEIQCGFNEDTVEDFAQDIESAYNTLEVDTHMERISVDLLENGEDYDCYKERLSWDFNNYVYAEFNYIIDSVSYDSVGGRKFAYIDRTRTFTRNGIYHEQAAENVILIYEDYKWKFYGNQLGYQNPEVSLAVTAEDGENNEPVNPKDTFTRSDSDVCVIIHIDNFRTSSTITREWISPDGSLVASGDWTIREDYPSCASGLWKFTTRYQIEGYEDWWKNHTGTWHVDIKIDNKLIKRVYFTYQDSSGSEINPTIIAPVDGETNYARQLLLADVFASCEVEVWIGEFGKNLSKVFSDTIGADHAIPAVYAGTIKSNMKYTWQLRVRPIGSDGDWEIVSATFSTGTVVPFFN